MTQIYTPTSVSAALRSRFLDLAVLSSLANMRLVTKRQIDGTFSGRHRSRQRGGAGEFVDYREYVDGEDLRRLDWKVLGRTGRAYTRLYQDETNLLATLAIDISESMRFGSQDVGGGRAKTLSKLEYAQYLTTALSQLIFRQQDQVGLALAGAALREYLPPAGTLGHVLTLQQAIENIITEPQTGLSEALGELFRRVTRRGVLMVVSDFLMEDLDKLFASIRLFIHRRWEVVILHLIHPAEERLPEGLAFRFEGMENDGRVDTSPSQIKAAYEERFEAHVTAVRTAALAEGCDYRRISTATPYLQTLHGFLIARGS